VKARAEGTQWSEPFSYSFSINPPWYQSSMAYLAYIGLLIAGGFWAFRIREAAKSRRARIQEILKENKILTYGNSHILNLSSTEDKFVQLINKTLEAHLSDENFGIAELCDVLNISRAQLHRKLKKITGLSTSHYIRTLRLHYAKELLDKSELNISEVAFNVGFSSATYFSKVFKAQFGFAPRELR
jgi:transcriptional regulator GlxA family with amidase domain